MKKSLLLGFLIGQTVYSAPRIEIEPPVLPDENFSSIAVQDELITRKLEVTDRAIICKDVYLCDVTIGDNLLIQGDLSVEGTSNLNDVTLSGDATLTNLTVTGNTNLNELTVSGNSQLTDLTVTGDTLLSNGSVTGNFTIDGTLFVSTPISFDSLSITNDADIGCNLTVGCNIYTQNTNSTIGAYYKGGLPWIHNFGPNNTFLGTQAGNFTITGGNNAGLGDSTLINLSSGNFNTGLGRGAGFDINTGSSNIVIGYLAGAGLTTGSGNIYINANAGAPAESNTTRIGTGQTRNFQAGIRGAVPANTDTALVSIDSANQLGTGRIYNDVDFANTTTTQGAILKNGVLWMHNSGPDGLFVGPSAGNRTTTGFRNIGIGSSALFEITSGIANIGIGIDSIRNITTGSGNVGVGAFTLQVLTANNGDNTAIGTSALTVLSIGNRNTVVGSNGFDSLTLGSNNTGLGSNVFTAITSGNNNIGIGTNAGSAMTTNSNNIYIGNVGVPGEDNVIRLGDNSHTQFRCEAVQNFSYPVSAPLDVVTDFNSDSAIGVNTSSRRFKENIQTVSSDVANLLLKANPVTFNYIAHKDPKPLHYGLIAEEIEEILPDLVAYKDGEPISVIYRFLYALLLKLIQDNRAMIEELQNKAPEKSSASIKTVKNELLEYKKRLEVTEKQVNEQQTIIGQLQEKLAAQDNFIQSFSSDIVMLKAIIESISRTTRIS